MKFTLAWLKDHLETDAALDEICRTLDVVGLEVESVENPADTLGNFVVAKVLEAKPHPDADRLRVCMVDYGGKAPIQVVCGAPNARTGLVGVFAPEGTYVPGTDLLLKATKIRGVESSGMLCSERELELSDEHDGIIDLDAALAERVGERYVDIAGLNDPVIEIAITPNRPDALGVRGVARDLAAAGLGTLKPEPEGFTAKGAYPCPVPIELRFQGDAADACTHFVGRYVKGVKNGPSPDWLQRRLKAIGLRPINALVDVTNYISYDRARPLHVYDADKLQGTIHARLAVAGDQFEALDDRTYEIGADGTITVDGRVAAERGGETVCVIADDSGAIGFGGIMGGASTGCTEETTNVFIESAYFDPVRTANSGRATGILSDARYRFERGIDRESCMTGADLGAQMVVDLCGGSVSERGEAGRTPDGDKDIAFDIGLVEGLTGLKVKDTEIKRILGDLGFKVAGKPPKLKVTPPPWRPDIGGAADFVEEVIRIVGIDTVPATPLPRVSGVARAVMTEAQKRVRVARRLLAERGLVEAVTWSFITGEEAEHFGGGAPELKLANPISADLSDMRPSLLPGLLAAGQRNRDRAVTDLALFEVGQIYHGEKPEDQSMAATGLRMGAAGLAGAGRHWAGSAPAVDLFDAKADLMALLAAMGLDPAKLQIMRDVPGWFHPGRAGAVKLGPKVTLGVFGEIHPATLTALDVDGPVVAFEANLNALPTPKRKTIARGALATSDLQPVKRDFAFLLDDDTAAGAVVRAALGAEKKLVSDVTVFDIFRGKGVPEGKKSLAIEVTLQPQAETLTDKEIEAVADKIIAQVKKATGGEIRG